MTLQEVLCIHRRNSEDDQAHFIAHGLISNYCMGHNRELRGGVYGNLVLSRFPLLGSENHDISVAGREARGCLRVDVALGKEHKLHVYNAHLGTSFIERRQARKLIGESILSDANIPGPRIMLGDFNEWTRGLVTRLLNEHSRNGDIRLHLKRWGAYPGLLPIMHLDHIYFDETLELEHAELHRSRASLLASDHLPNFRPLRNRLTTVRKADVIFVLQDGVVVESGAHNELLARGGLYAHLHEIQISDKAMIAAPTFE